MAANRPGLWQTPFRGLLRIAELPYACGVAFRNSRYDNGGNPASRVDVPVVSVGNITTGGTGKTPMVAWLTQWFQHRQIDVALVSRGYGAEDGEPNDEALELRRRFPSVPHIQNRDRVTAARQAIQQFGSQVIILDDGFQHRRIHRDLDVVLIDALEPFGYGHLLPRGLLREPLSQLRRADVIALSRATNVDGDRRHQIRDQVKRYAPKAVWIELMHRPADLVQLDGNSMPVESLQGKRVAALSGIGNPKGFRRTLEQLGCEIAGFRTYPDHHAFSSNDLAELAQWGTGIDSVECLICTCKDLVKLKVEQIGGRPLFALAIEIVVLAGEAELVGRLETVVAKAES